MSQNSSPIDFAHRQTRQTWIAVGGLLAAAAWAIRLRFVDIPCRPPTYRIPDGSGPVDVFAYSKLLADHNPLLTCMMVTLPLIILVAMVGVALLISPGRRPILEGVLVLLAGIFACGGLMGTLFSGDGTTLQEIHTMQYNGRVYHLVVADVVAGGMDVYLQPIYLFDCNPPGEVCRATTIDYLDYHAATTPTLDIDLTTHHLIIRNGPTVIYTRNAAASP